MTVEVGHLRAATGEAVGVDTRKFAPQEERMALARRYVLAEGRSALRLVWLQYRIARLSFLFAAFIMDVPWGIFLAPEHRARAKERNPNVTPAYRLGVVAAAQLSGLSHKKLGAMLGCTPQAVQSMEQRANQTPLFRKRIALIGKLVQMALSSP
jgi:hypothetical protein